MIAPRFVEFACFLKEDYSIFSSMEDLNKIFSHNLITLRKAKKLTQLELANELGYSDKNISKWENEQAIPSAEYLLIIANYFGVTVDYLLKEHKEKESVPVKDKRSSNLKIKLLIAGISTSVIIMIAILIFIITKQYLTFIWGLPTIAILWIVFISIWFKIRPYLFIAISLLAWTTILAVFLTLLEFYSSSSWNWFIWLIGVPAQVAIFLWSKFYNK